jgi:hypothetical protein
MRYFWSLILVLAVVTAGLFTLRLSRERAALTPVAAAAPASGGMGDAGFGQRPARPAEPPVVAAEPSAAPEPVIAAGPEAGVVPAAASESMTEPELSPAVNTVPETVAAAAPPEVSAVPVAPAPEANFSLDALLGVVAEAADRIEATPAEAPATPVAENAAAETDPMMEAALAANTPATSEAVTPAAPASTPAAPAAPAGPVGPTFEVRADGSLSVEGVGVVPGDGTAQRPFVLDWEVLRSVQREFNPRQGQSEVPAWLKVLDGKRVRIEGNTLLPVVAQTTTELLVMQNPWDGCCLGVPPTPYDAIEVKLAKAQRMGNSPTGFGQVEGVFKVDPYIVSGWLLGLFMVEDAAFESAAGIVLPEI